MAAYEKAGKSDDWRTPKYIFDALDEEFDLDVAASPDGNSHVPAKRFVCKGSLEIEWEGFVWMNPPFGHQRHKRAWLRKFFDHGHGIALVPDRTSAPWFQEYAPRADAMLFMSPKVKFIAPDGSIGQSPGTGTVLLASGNRAFDALIRAEHLGMVALPLLKSAS